MTIPNSNRDQRLGPAEMRECIEALREDFAAAEVIHQAGNRTIIRWPWPTASDSIIIKMWSRPDVIGGIRRKLHLAPSDIEYRNLMRVRRLGIPVPMPLGSCAVFPCIEGNTDAIFMEDLGECVLATDYLKHLISEGRELEAQDFEDATINMVEVFVRAGMLDVDHGFANMLVPKSGRPVRLDLELLRFVAWPNLFTGMYGEMLGRMIVMHAFAVQPDTTRTTKFAGRLIERIQPPHRSLVTASRFARKMLRAQTEEVGIDTFLILPWDKH